MKPGIALITGVTSGIGEATARLLASHGWDLIVTGRRRQRLEKITEELREIHKVRILPLCFDVRDQKAVDEHLDTLPEEWKAVDVLINNAGLSAGRESIHEGSLDDWEVMIDTNIKGLLYVSRKIIPGMVERERGHIVNIGSIAGKEPYLHGNVYCASKFAIDGLSRAMRMDLLPFGIKVSQVAPGAVNTEFSLVRFKGDQAKADKVYEGTVPLQAEDIADAIYYVISRPEHVVVSDMVVFPTAQASATMVHRKLS